MVTLLVAVCLAVLFSFTCSLLEAALYALPWSTIELLRKKGDKTGQLLYEMRTNIDKPIAAILTVNTIANTAGATIAGGAFSAVFGDIYMGFFAAFFTLLILALGEIIPKTLGVLFSAPIAKTLAYPLFIVIKILAPVIFVLEKLTGFCTRNSSQMPQISEDDICAAAGLSRKGGHIKEYEENCVRNVLALDHKHVHEIMTPRTVVFSLPSTMSVSDAYKEPQIWQFSRIPVFGQDNEDVVGLVERREIAYCINEQKGALPITEIMRPIYFVQESQTLDVVLQQMLNAHVHLFAVLDEYGGLSGVVSLEDVLEEMLGSEIVDESDKVADMRALARQKSKSRSKNRNKSKSKNKK
ncbi:MAG: HlyC/CorC family transporter [Desulfovibrio sp.]|nr:HlyC/CorC family transporter [Desulfovibrio sp.]